MYRAYTLVKTQRLSNLVRQSTTSIPSNRRHYSKKNKFSIDFEDDEDLVIDTRIQEKKVEIIKEKHVDIDDMLATTTLRDLKLMRWTDNYEGLELAKRENVDLHNAFTPDETTEEVQARIAARESAELKGSKFQSVKLSYNQLSNIKTDYVAGLLNQFKETFEKPLVNLYKDTIKEANDIYFSTRADKKRLLKEKLRNTVRRKLSGLESHFQDLIFVRNAIQHAIEEPSRLDPNVVDEAWNRMLERSEIMDPDSLARDLMSDEYNDLGAEYEYAEHYITQLSMIPYDFRNPKSFNSLVELYDKFIEESLPEDSNSSTGIYEMNEQQLRFDRDIDQLRKIVVDCTPEELEALVTVKLNNSDNLIDIPSEISKDFASEGRVIYGVIETLRHRVMEEIEESVQEAINSEKGDLNRDDNDAESTPVQINGGENTLSNAAEKSLTASQLANRRLQEKFELLLVDIQAKIDRIEDTPARSIGTAANAGELLAMSKKHLTGIQYDEQKFLDIAFPDEKVVEEGSENAESTPAKSTDAADEEPLLTNKDVAQAKLDNLLKHRNDLVAKGVSVVDVEFAIENAKFELESLSETEANEIAEAEDDDDFAIVEDDNEIAAAGEEEIDEDDEIAENELEEDDEQDGEDDLLAEGDEETSEAQIKEQIEDLPDFKALSSKLMETQSSELTRIAKKFAGQPLNEKTASEVLDELYKSHLDNHVMDKNLIKHDYDVLREAHGDVHMPTSVQFQYDTNFRDLVDRDVIFKMPLKDTDMVRVLTHQLSEFGLVDKNRVLRESPDNIPVPKEIVEDKANDALFPDILDHIDGANELGFGSNSKLNKNNNNNENNNNNNNNSTDISTKSNKQSKNTTQSTNTQSTNNTSTTTNTESTQNDTDAIYDPRRLYTELNPIFEDNGVLTLPPKEDLRKKVKSDGSEHVKGPSGYSPAEAQSNDIWLMGKPFDIAKYRLGGQENPLPIYRFNQPTEFSQDDEDPAPPPDQELFTDVETYRYLQEGKGEEWFGPEKVGDKHIDPLNQAMRWYPREHLPTYPFQFEISHNTQDQYTEDFWSNRKVIMRVNVAALGLPEVVEERLAALTKARYDPESRILTLVANNHKSQDENKHQCKSLFRNLLHEAYLADPNFVSVRADNYQPEKLVSTFVPSKSAKKLERFNLFRLTGFPTLQEQNSKQQSLDKLKQLL